MMHVEVDVRAWIALFLCIPYHNPFEQRGGQGRACRGLPPFCFPRQRARLSDYALASLACLWLHCLQDGRLLREMLHIKVDVKTRHRVVPTLNSIPTLLQRWQRSHTLLRDDKVRALLVAVSAYTDESLASFDSGAVTCRICFVCVP